MFVSFPKLVVNVVYFLIINSCHLLFDMHHSLFSNVTHDFIGTDMFKSSLHIFFKECKGVIV